MALPVNTLTSFQLIETHIIVLKYLSKVQHRQKFHDENQKLTSQLYRVRKVNAYFLIILEQLKFSKHQPKNIFHLNKYDDKTFR